MAVKTKRKATTASVDEPLISDAKLQQLYATMLQCRLLSERVRRVRARKGVGRMFAACVGHEAIATGCAIDLGLADTVTLAPHDATATLALARLANGRPLSELMRELSVLVAGSTDTQLTAAIKVAKTNKRKKNSRVVVVFTHAEAAALTGWRRMLAAATRSNLPMIFVVERNRSTAQQSNRQDTPGKKRTLPRIPVDGNDVVAVYRVAHESLARVRRGDGPVLIEGVVYRLSTQKRVPPHDPLQHMEQYLKARKLWPARWKQQLVRNFSLQLDAALLQAKQAQSGKALSA